MSVDYAVRWHPSQLAAYTEFTRMDQGSDFMDMLWSTRGLVKWIRSSVKVSGLAFLQVVNQFSRSIITRPGGPIVSLTTHGPRIESVHYTIESIGRGRLRPSRLILWIDDRSLYEQLPRALSRLKERGLEVKFSDNFGPHTKYYPFIESEANLDAPLVTADDDILYPSYWLCELARAYAAFPQYNNCFRARTIALFDSYIAEYAKWELCASTAASFSHVANGVSGVVYSPRFQQALKVAGREFMGCCPKADDLWLHVQALRSGFRIRQIGKKAVHFPLIPGSQEVALFKGNCLEEDGNDRQVKATYKHSDISALLRESGKG